jgi:hypothetical protein
MGKCIQKKTGNPAGAGKQGALGIPSNPFEKSNYLLVNRLTT